MGPYHGWVISYDARTLRQTGVFNTSPDSTESGIWSSDTGPAADSEGNVYVVTGNGRFDAASGGRDYGDSVLKLQHGSNGIGVADYFTPSDEARLNAKDGDLGSGGAVWLRDARRLAVAGKEGTIYLLDSDRMGKYRPGNNGHAVSTAKLAGDVFGAGAFWNGKLYFLAERDVLKSFSAAGDRLNLMSQSADEFGGSGATPAISADGSKDGIVWVIERRGPGRMAILHAFDAEDLSRELYRSSENPGRDAAGEGLRFTIPTVAGGRVFVGTRGEVDAYGLLDGNILPDHRKRGKIHMGRQ